MVILLKIQGFPICKNIDWQMELVHGNMAKASSIRWPWRVKLTLAIHFYFEIRKPNLASLVLVFIIFFTWRSLKVCFLAKGTANCPQPYLPQWAYEGVSGMVSTPQTLWIANLLCNSKVMQQWTSPPVIFLHLGASGHRHERSAVIVSVSGVTLPYCRED